MNTKTKEQVLTNNLRETLKTIMQKEIEKLPETLKVVFLLRDVEGLSIEDTADSLGISQAAVKTRLLRARLRLRDELSTYYRERMVEK